MRPYFRSLGMFVVTALVLSLLTVTALAEGPRGAGPTDPLMVPTNSQAIDPDSTLWFYFDYSVDTSTGGGFGRGRAGPVTRSPVNVTVDANGASGLGLAVYTPSQARDWMADPTTTPVGRGSPFVDTSSGLVTHDVYWSGAFNTSGRYLLALSNSSSSPISFRLTVTGDAVTLFPVVAPSPTPTLPIPFTPSPIPTGTLEGKIVFENATGGDIYTVNGDGSSLARVTRGIDPAWSPDGKKIVFARWDNTNPGLYIADADGANEQLLFGAPRVRWPRPSPDGKYIVFSQDKSKADNNIIWKLGLIDLATGQFTEPRCSQLCFAPSWGTDSATLVYTDPNIGILATNAFSGSESLLGPTGSYWDSAAGFARPIVHFPPMQNSILSPDGKRIVYSMQAHDRWELNLMNADGRGQTGLTKPDPIAYYLLDIADHNVAPIWSPDGQEILFLSDRNGKGKWEFFITDMSGTNIRQVLKNVTDQISVKFSFEGERIMDWVK